MKQQLAQRKASQPDARKRVSSAGASGQTISPANRTGLPDGLKNGVQALSGFSLDDVRVHFNSQKPAQLNAFAYAKERDIHLAPGQERYLPHEAWHIVQQRQGRVKPTDSIAATPINDNPLLEQEADQMGAKVMKMHTPLEQPKEHISFPAPNQQSTFAANRSGGAPAQLGKKDLSEKNYYKNKHYKFSYLHKKRHAVFNSHIDRLIDGIDSDRSHLDRFQYLKGKGTTYYRNKLVSTYINKSKRDITEKIGELNATQYMVKNYPNAKMLLGFGKGVGLDQVYKDGDRIIVVEAKGPGAKLGTSDRKGKQMSIPWVLETVRGMKDQDLAGKILKKHREKKLVRLVIYSTPDGHAPRRMIDEF